MNNTIKKIITALMLSLIISLGASTSALAVSLGLWDGENVFAGAWPTAIYRGQEVNKIGNYKTDKYEVTAYGNSSFCFVGACPLWLTYRVDLGLNSKTPFELVECKQTLIAQCFSSTSNILAALEKGLSK